MLGCPISVIISYMIG